MGHEMGFLTFISKHPSRPLIFWILILLGVCVIAQLGVPRLQPERQTQTVSPTHRISVSDSFPDYVFIIYKPVYHYSSHFGLINLSTAEYVELTPNNPIKIPAEDWHRNDQGISLIIAPKAESFRTAPELAEAVVLHQVENVVRYEFSNREAVPDWYGTEVTINYRVQFDKTRTPTRLEVLRITTDERYQYSFVAIMMTVVAILGGQWFIRKWIRGTGSKGPEFSVAEQPTSPVPARVEDAENA